MRGRWQVAVAVGALLLSACGGAPTVDDRSAAATTTAAADPVTSPAGTTSAPSSPDAPSSSAPASQPASTTMPSPAVSTTAAPATATGAPDPIPPCDEPPYPRGPAAVTAEGRNLATVQRALFDLVRANRRLLSGTWWDPEAQALVLAAKDTAQAPGLLATIDTDGVPVRIEPAELTYEELEDLGSKTIAHAAFELGATGRDIVRADLVIELTPDPADQHGIDAYTESVGADTRWFCWRI